MIVGSNSKENEKPSWFYNAVNLDKGMFYFQAAYDSRSAVLF